MGALRSFGGLGVALILPAWAAAPATVEIQLRTVLDEPRGYCIDMAGYKERARTDRPLQAHTCYSYQGTIAVDQGVDPQGVGSGRIGFPYFGVCMRAERRRAGASLGLAECADTPEQRFRFTDAGEIRPHAAPELCVTIAPGPGAAGGGGRPVHLLRALTLEACAESTAARQQWRLR